MLLIEPVSTLAFYVFPGVVPIIVQVCPFLFCFFFFKVFLLFHRKRSSICMIALHSVTNLVLCLCVSVFCDFHLGWSPAPGFLTVLWLTVVLELSGRVGHPEVAHFSSGCCCIVLLGCFGCCEELNAKEAKGKFPISGKEGLRLSIFSFMEEISKSRPRCSVHLKRVLCLILGLKI